jgi:hypothetical protein
VIQASDARGVAVLLLEVRAEAIAKDYRRCVEGAERAKRFNTEDMEKGGRTQRKITAQCKFNSEDPHPGVPAAGRAVPGKRGAGLRHK